jgi:hypothetical protein
MTTRDNAAVAELIERLERASEGSAELDKAIAFAAGYRARYTVDGMTYFTPPAGDQSVMRPPPPFTESIDGALSLVPEGCFWIIARGKTRPDEPLFGARVMKDLLSREEVIGEAEHEASAALALCIAALKARSAS